MRTRARRGLVAVLLAAVAIAGCSGDEPEAAGQTPGDPITGVTDPETGCGPVEHPPLQVSTHLVGDAEPPSPYTSVPPTSGWHTAEPPAPGVATEPLRDPEIVSALESGIVVLAVSPDLVDDTTVTDVAAQFPDRVLVVPYDTEMPTPVALLSWGTVQRCPEVDRTTVTTFVLEHRTSVEH